MATEVKANYRKQTWTGRLNTDTSGRSGVFNHAGHFTKYLCGVHISLVEEPDRPISVQLNKGDAVVLMELLTAFLDQPD